MASEELAIYVRMKDFASKEAAKIGNAIGGIYNHVFSLKNALIGLAGGFGMVKLIDTAAQLEEVENAFSNMSKSAGGAKAVLDALRKGMEGTVNEMEMMRLGNEALMLEVASTAEEMGLLAEVANKLGRAYGQEVGPAFEAFIQGLATGSAKSLRHLKIVVDETEAVKEYARAHGIVAEKMGEWQKKQALVSAILERAGEIIRSQGDDVKTLGEAWGSFKANLANLGLDVLREFTPIMRETFEYLAKWIKDNKPVIVEAAATIVDSIGYVIEALASLAASIERTIVSFTKFSSLDIWSVAIGPGGKAITETLAKRFGAEGWLPWEQEQNKAAEMIEKGGKVLKDKLHGVAEAIRSEAKDIRDAEGDLALERLAADLERIAHPKFEWQGALPEWEGIENVNQENINAINAMMDSQVKKREEWTRQQQRAAEEELKLFEEGNVFVGARKKLKEFQTEFLQFGVLAGQALEGVGSAISSNLGDAFTALITGAKSAKQAFADMARSMISDIVRITMQLMAMTVVKGLFGLAVLGEGGIVPGHLAPRVRGRFAGGSIAGMHGYYELAERGQPEAVIPLRGGAVPVKMLGGRRGGSVVQNIVNVTLNSKSYSSSEERALLLRNAKDIGNIVVQKMQTSFRFREGMAA